MGHRAGTIVIFTRSKSSLQDTVFTEVEGTTNPVIRR